MEYNIYIKCRENLMIFNNRKEAQSFFLRCMYSCEGAEREDYTTIYLRLQNKKNRFISFGSEKISKSDINLSNARKEDLKQIMKFFNLNENDIYSLMKENKLNNKIEYDEYLEINNKEEDICL